MKASDPTPAPEPLPRTGDLYDSGYYDAYLSGEHPYRRDEYWLGFFGSVADRIVADLQPATVLDAGCAMGFLVESLRDRGVDAYGIDVSEHAISQVREDIRPYCRVGSITEPLPRRYDLVTCIEVMEHLPAPEAEKAIQNLAASADAILFSSSPDDPAEPTHFNARPPEEWAEAFARHGLHHDLGHDPSTYLSPWGALFRRDGATPPRLARRYERAYWWLKRENLALRSRLVELTQRTAEMEASLAAANAKAAALEVHVAGMEATRAWRLAEAVRRLRGARRPSPPPPAP